MAVLGGGLVGLETADFLRAQGKAVTILEKLPEVASYRRVEGIFRAYLLNRLSRTDESVLILTSSNVSEIGPDYVIIEQNGNERKLSGIDSVVLATGFRPTLPFEPDIISPDCEVHVIGDAREPRTIFEAIHSAAKVAYGL